jgi:hypothetical protein
MKRLFLCSLLVLALAGCAQHYYRLNDGNLRIFLKAPDATSVYFASSQDNFALHPAQKTGSGTWVISVDADRQFSYFYVIDGQPYVPECTYKEHDDFGGENCVFIPGM